jgi:hypothetical protein
MTFREPRATDLLVSLSNRPATSTMATEPLTRGAVIVLERTGRLAVLLRGSLPEGVRLIETRSAQECEQALNDWPASVVLIELARGKGGGFSPMLERCVRLVERVSRRNSLACMAILAERSFAALEHLLLEAGAKHVILGLRDLDRLTRWIAWRSAQWPKPLTLRQEVVRSLPWADEAADAGK